MAGGILIGAPELSQSSQAKVEAAIAAITAVSEISDAAEKLVAAAMLHMRAGPILADPALQLGCHLLRMQGRLHIPGGPL